MSYTTEELFAGKSEEQIYALKQKYKECQSCGWVEKSEFGHEDDITCIDCLDDALDRMD